VTIEKHDPSRKLVGRSVGNFRAITAERLDPIESYDRAMRSSIDSSRSPRHEEEARPMTRRSSWRKSPVVFGAALAFSLAALAVACGSEDGSGHAACEGAACDDAGAVDGSTGSDTSTADGAADAVADAHDAADGDVTCPGPAGTLDPTFGDGGMVVIAFPGEQASADAVITQPDGRIVVAGVKTPAGDYFDLVRLTATGALDSTFGDGGVTQLRVGNTSHATRAVARQPDGKLLLAGYTRFVGQNFDFAVLRFTADGVLDTTFGTNGVVLTDFGTNTDQAMAMAVMPDGRIVVSGQTLSDDLTVADMAFARYNSDGSLDTTFGSGGRATVDVRSTPDQARAIALLAGGKVLAAGTTRDPNTSRTDITAVRLNVDGSLDTAFGDQGKFVSTLGGPGNDTGNALALDAKANLVTAGLAGGIDFGTTRLTSAGTPDPTFGASGVVRTDFDGRNDHAAGVAVQEDGKIIVAGSSLSATPSDGRIAIVRHLTNGAPDPTFGASGLLLRSLPTGFSGTALANGIVLDRCGGVIVGSWFDDAAGPSGESRIGVMRFRR